MDAISQFKESAKQQWSTFARMEALTATAAPHLLRVAHVRAGQQLLDVACGTGVVALSAARLGATVTGLDLTPPLIAHARENAAIMGLAAEFVEGDAEALPFGDARFDVVLSQFGHMFAPRPEVATRELLRVLKPGGTLAFSTWPPELFVGKFFALSRKWAPEPPPAGVAPPPQWGDPNIVRERLGDAVHGLTFHRAVMRVPALSVQHARLLFEDSIGPLSKLVEVLAAQAPEKLAALREELEALIAEYFDGNQLMQAFLITRAIKL